MSALGSENLLRTGSLLLDIMYKFGATAFPSVHSCATANSYSVEFSGTAIGHKLYQ